jgi:cellulose synthase/poly-beta-1,6-N-acetylglucosamine synthase-like glycosyltransferase
MRAKRCQRFISKNSSPPTERVGEPAMMILRGINEAMLWYFVALNTATLALVALAATHIIRRARRASFVGYDDTFANPLTPPISIVVPAHNEAAVIHESVQAMLALRYSEFEVIVVDDGSTDETFAILEAAYRLQLIDRASPGQVPALGEVQAVYGSTTHDMLTVVRKVSVGLRADAVNAGIDLARYPLVCLVDADSILEETALLRIVQPFVEDPEHVIASGGVVAVANGSSVYRGRIENVRHSRHRLARIQSVEYARSFLLGRLGWAQLDSLLIISGAFGLFRRDLLLRIGGLDPESMGEDAELVITLHERMRRDKRDYRVAFVPEPVAWTEVPETLAILGRQRRRWSRGLAQIMTKHRRMLGNPRFGRVGLLALPFYFLFELLSPVIELAGLVALVAGFALGAIDWQFAAWLAVVAMAYSLFVSACALTIEEMMFRRYPRWRDLQRSFFAAIWEVFGYRQLNSWWRFQGLLDHLFKRKANWGVMSRTGFQTVESPVLGAAREHERCSTECAALAPTEAAS